MIKSAITYELSDYDVRKRQISFEEIRTDSGNIKRMDVCAISKDLIDELKEKQRIEEEQIWKEMAI